jgi:hypothetical protein
MAGVRQRERESKRQTSRLPRQVNRSTTIDVLGTLVSFCRAVYVPVESKSPPRV